MSRKPARITFPVPCPKSENEINEYFWYTGIARGTDDREIHGGPFHTASAALHEALATCVAHAVWSTCVRRLPHDPANDN